MLCSFIYGKVHVSPSDTSHSFYWYIYPFLSTIFYLLLDVFLSWFVPFFCLIWVFEVDSRYAAQAGQELCLPAFTFEVIGVHDHTLPGIHTYTLGTFRWCTAEKVSSSSFFFNARLEISTVSLLLLYLQLFENEIFIFDELSHHTLEDFLNSNRLICFYLVISLTVWLLNCLYIHLLVYPYVVSYFLLL